MNGKVSKSIRRLAESKSIGKPYTVYNKVNKTITLGDCGRKEYKKLKKAFKSNG